MPWIVSFEVWPSHGKKRLKKMIKTTIMPTAPSVFLINAYIGPDVGIVFLHKRGISPDAPLVFLIKTAFGAIPLFDQKCKTYILAATGPARTRKSYSRPDVAAPQMIRVLCRAGAGVV